MNAELHSAVERLQSTMQADGTDVELLAIEDGTARLRLVFDPDACEECVVPKQVMETVALRLLGGADESIKRVEIDDPRAG